MHRPEVFYARNFDYVERGAGCVDGESVPDDFDEAVAQVNGRARGKEYSWLGSNGASSVGGSLGDRGGVDLMRDES